MKDYKVGKETMSDAFCREVYAVVRDIPAGKVISYGEIAALLGKPQWSIVLLIHYIRYETRL